LFQGPFLDVSHRLRKHPTARLVLNAREAAMWHDGC